MFDFSVVKIGKEKKCRGKYQREMGDLKFLLVHYFMQIYSSIWLLLPGVTVVALELGLVLRAGVPSISILSRARRVAGSRCLRSNRISALRRGSEARKSSNCSS